MNIMISIDRAFIPYACIMLMSLKNYHKDILLSVYILHSELSDEDFLQMDEIIGSEGIELIPVFIPEGTVKDFQIGEWPEAAAFRLLAVDLFADSMERILHLDTDILITGDITQFYHTPFEGNYLAGCEEFLSPKERQRKNRENGRDENMPYFNSGVLLFNLQKLKQDGFYYAFYQEVFRKYQDLKIVYPDQDLLNLIFGSRTKYMDKMRYNYAPFVCKMNDREHFYDSKEELEEHVSIVHMRSGTKPWLNASKLAADEMWWEYAGRTPFYAAMKAQHVQTMLHKERKVNALNHDKLAGLMREADSQEKLPALEEILYRVLEKELAMMELFEDTN